MVTPVSLLCLSVWSFHIASDDTGAWAKTLSAMGFTPGAAGLHVLGPEADPGPWRSRVEQGAVIILEGPSQAAAAFGFKTAPGKKTPVRSVVDAHNPRIEIIWQRVVELPSVELAPEAQVFTREKWTGLPLVCGRKVGAGAVLWLAAPPGERGYERFPYLAQALASLGVEPPFRSRHLWAFFDSSYRLRVDLDYFAARWRNSGIASLHVAAWHYFERDAGRDAWLARLIAACHKQAITVYAWIELPHVSEQFWERHPEWREKTAAGQDAHLDWRKLMDLTNPDCARAVSQGLAALMERFDWDGVNLAELYFESLEGHANAARFTPMNRGVRAEFEKSHGFDPATLFPKADPSRLRLFLDWRAGLARRLQEHWLGEIERIRASRPDLGLVLTHIDDRYDAGMRDALGADAGAVLPLLRKHDFQFLIEDPATIWHLGPERYADIAARYAPLAPRPARLGIDINVVERYQDVYPTRQQTGVELFQLVNSASRAFPRVALYFENSLLPVDLPWLGSAAAAAERREVVGGRLIVETRKPAGIPWKGPAKVNGRVWPWSDGETVWLPAGSHAIEAAPRGPAMALLDFSADVLSLSEESGGLELGYRSDSSAWAVVDRRPGAIQIDGEAAAPAVAEAGAGRYLLRLPRGQHLVGIRSGGISGR